MFSVSNARFLTLTLSLAALVGVGCTDAELCVVDDPTSPMACEPYTPPPQDNRLEVQGVSCTVEPTTLIFPHKVLFVIDVSGSNADSDPTGRRGQAVWNAIQEHNENRAVSFGIIRFTNFAENLTGGFTKDAALLQSLMPRLNEAIDATHYVETLDLVYKTIEDDAKAMADAERSRTTYIIHWLSDGQPMIEVGCEPPELVVAKTDLVMSLEAKYGFFDMFLHTTRLSSSYHEAAGANCPAPPGPYYVENYLPPMAQHGNGTYRELSAANLDFPITFTEVRRVYSRRDFYIVNESRMLVDGALLADSDGDGIRDLDEVNEPDPLLVDANHDGCSDRVDELLRPNDRTLCSDHCAAAMVGGDPLSLADQDADGLPDCVEQMLGTRRDSADSDADGFPDPLEVKLGTNPLDADTERLDSDKDGVSDADEIRQGTNPLSAEHDTELTYSYAPLGSVVTNVDGTECVEFRVENVRLVETLETATHKRGDNIICAYLVQASSDDPNGTPLVTRACKTARYLQGTDHDLKEPANGFLRFEATDFDVAYQSLGAF